MTLSTRPTITAFERSPDGGKGMARDMRVRWALEEAIVRDDRRRTAPRRIARCWSAPGSQ
jgi:hypothetical protein